METQVVTATTRTAVPFPPRPTMYALACLIDGKWTLSYGGCRREWIVESQQPLYPGSVLVEVPGEAHT